MAGLLQQQYANGLLNQDPLIAETANRNMLAQALKARQTTPRNALTGQGLLDTAAIGLSPIPVIGDLLGLGADANRFINEPESRTPLNFGLAALGLIPFVPPLVSAGLGKFAQSQGKQIANLPTGPARNQAGAIVYHGSPHKFDAFDSSKIGTGEGAQAYGHGLYFAENPDVAKQYIPRDLKTEDKIMRLYKQAETRQDWNSMSVLEDALTHKTPSELKELYPDQQGLINQIAKIQSTQKGNIYKVDLPDEAIAKMLDYDAPLSKQPEQVRNAIESALKDDPVFNAWKTNGAIDSVSGGLLYGRVVEKMGPYPGGTVGASGSQSAKATELLNSLGVPGIRYLDGGSRGAGEGTRNFVTFPGNEGLLKILERQ